VHNIKFLFDLHLGEFTTSAKVWFSYDLFMGSLTQTDKHFANHLIYKPFESLWHIWLYRWWIFLCYFTKYCT